MFSCTVSKAFDRTGQKYTIKHATTWTTPFHSSKHPILKSQCKNLEKKTVNKTTGILNVFCIFFCKFCTLFLVISETSWFLKFLLLIFYAWLRHKRVSEKKNCWCFTLVSVLLICAMCSEFCNTVYTENNWWLTDNCQVKKCFIHKFPY